MEKRYCAAPWRSLHINPTGDVKTCCAGNPSMLGNLNSQSIEEIFRNPVLQEIRSTIKSGKLHDTYCKNCIHSEKYGRSERDWHNNINEFFDCSTAELDDYKVVLADIRWSTLCNLSCNYCDFGSSSRWAKLSNLPVDEQTKKYYPEVVNFISKNIKDMQELALVGGEPLLMKENLELLDFIPESVLVTLITNLAVDFKKNKLIKKLLKRPRVGWSISFDNVGEKFEYVRYGNSWDRMDHNVSVIAEKINKDSHHGGIHSVYNLYNCTRLVELKKYAVSKDLSIHWQSIGNLDVLDVSCHNTQVRKLALEEIQNLKKNFNLEYSENNFISTVENILKNKITSDSDISHKFHNFTQKIENLYHPNSKKFSDLWPELDHAIFSS